MLVFCVIKIYNAQETVKIIICRLSFARQQLISIQWDHHSYIFKTQQAKKSSLYSWYHSLLNKKKMFLVSDYAVSYLPQMSSPVEDTRCTHKRAEVTSNTLEGEGVCLKI